MTLNRRTWLYLIGAEVLLFVLANVFSKSHSHPGTVSNVFWDSFVVGVPVLIVLGIVALIQRRRTRTV